MILNDENRWALPDLASAIAWSFKRQSEGIAVALDALGEYAKTSEQAFQAANDYLHTLQAIKNSGLSKAGIAIKPSALGLKLNRDLAENYMRQIARLGQKLEVPVEVDMEGTPTVNDICEIAQKLSGEGFSLVLALQAYLDRTATDLASCIKAGLKIRLVKGAYMGDTSDFSKIQQRLINLFKQAMSFDKSLDVGTHDPYVVEQLKTHLDENTKALVTFGFLKGLADQSKLKMVKEGFQVSEYVPFGNNRSAYIKRREAYLKNLSALQLLPLP
ncbi:MAG: proline dehydrogenase [Candidatus Rifleibacteriota bacterium]